MPIQEHAVPVVHDVRRAQRVVTLEFGDRKDFDDLTLEYHRLFSELLGYRASLKLLRRAAAQPALVGRVLGADLLDAALNRLAARTVTEPRSARAITSTTGSKHGNQRDLTPAVGTAQHAAARERARR